MTARTLSSAAALALLAWGPATLAADSGKVDIEVITIAASGRGGEPNYDKRIPENVRKLLKKTHLAYAEYRLVRKERKPTPFEEKVSFELPTKWTLEVTPSATSSRTLPVRLLVRFLDEKKKRQLDSRLRRRYDVPFLLHHPEGSVHLVLAVSVYKPKEFRSRD
ncbi:MAG: hypothetical protein ACLF0G_11955 [Candidatus Brocadiia bacterium]